MKLNMYKSMGLDDMQGQAEWGPGQPDLVLHLWLATLPAAGVGIGVVGDP